MAFDVTRQHRVNTALYRGVSTMLGRINTALAPCWRQPKDHTGTCHLRVEYRLQVRVEGGVTVLKGYPSDLRNDLMETFSCLCTTQFLVFIYISDDNA